MSLSKLFIYKHNADLHIASVRIIEALSLEDAHVAVRDKLGNNLRDSYTLIPGPEVVVSAGAEGKTVEMAKLIEVCSALRNIVEGAASVPWINPEHVTHRLKDTKAWAEFYNVVSALHR